MDKADFIKFVRADLKKQDFKLQFKNSKYILEKCDSTTIKYSADFDEDTKTLHVAKKCKSWFQNVIHEYCHFKQFCRKTYCYKVSDKSYKAVSSWLGGKKKGGIKEHVFNCIAFEREAEMMAVDFINIMSLDISKDDYVRGANFYLYSWGYAFKTRKWYDPDPADRVSEMPIKFLETFEYLNPDMKWFE